MKVIYSGGRGRERGGVGGGGGGRGGTENQSLLIQCKSRLSCRVNAILAQNESRELQFQLYHGYKLLNSAEIDSKMCILVLVR